MVSVKSAGSPNVASPPDMRPRVRALVIDSMRTVPRAVWNCRAPVIFRPVKPPPIASESSRRMEGDRPPSYDGRRFRLMLHGGMPPACDFLLECRQDGEVVSGTYRGDDFDHGELLAIVRAMGCLEGRFQHVTARLRIETGRCWATPQHTTAGQMRLYIEWHISGREGVAVMEET